MTVFILTCRDGIFAKDGRGWYTSASGRAHGLAWPFPSTLLGAIRTAWGRHQEASAGRTFAQADWQKAKDILLGKTLALRSPFPVAKSIDESCRIWPVPRDALFLDKGNDETAIQRLDPREPTLQTLGSDDDPAREKLWVPVVKDKSKPKSPPAWWPEEVFVNWLAGNGFSSESAASGARPARRFQMHVGIDPKTFTAADHLLYGYDVLETLEGKPGKDIPHEWRIVCEVSGWDPEPNPRSSLTATLAGDRRPARLEKTDEKLFAGPEALTKAFHDKKLKGLRLVAVTPMASKEGWLPQEFKKKADEYIADALPGLTAPVNLRAAFVGRPQHVSGWDMAQGAPKPTTRLVPPGSVYFVEKCDGSSFTADEAKKLWLAALGERTDEGFGRIVPGIWVREEN